MDSFLSGTPPWVRLPDAAAEPASHHNVLASMNFIADSPLYKNEKPYHFESSTIPGDVMTNLVFETHHGIPVQDVRGREDTFSIDYDGFKYLKHTSKVSSQVGTTEYIYEYLEEITSLIKKEFEAAKVICYDFRLRRDMEKYEQVTTSDRTKPILPVREAHADQSPRGGFIRIKKHLREEEADLMLYQDWRVLIVNTWRPLYRPVLDSALAFCSYSSLAPEGSDMLVADRINPDNEGEILYAKYNSDQQWHYMSEQTPTDLTLFTSWDSRGGRGGKAQYCPHVAFSPPSPPLNTPKRESVETRAVVCIREPAL